MLMNGLILLTMCNCAAAIIKEPQPVYVINTKFMSVAKGTKSFDVRNGKDKMTAWVESPKLIEWSEIPKDLIAFPLEIWLLKIKPALRALAQKHKDDRD
jgi:hypothetical protein